MIRFSSENMGDFALRMPPLPTNVPSPTELREIAYTRRPTPGDTSLFFNKFKDNRNFMKLWQMPIN
jgi:hypothetical protein